MSWKNWPIWLKCMVIIFGILALLYSNVLFIGIVTLIIWAFYRLFKKLNWPIWLKLGLSFVLFFGLLKLLWFILSLIPVDSPSPTIQAIYFIFVWLFLNGLCNLPILLLFGKSYTFFNDPYTLGPQLNTLGIITTLIIYFIIGALIGWIISRIKSKNLEK